MKRKRYTEEQIIRILSEVESGQTVVATSRKYGVSEQSIHRWKAKYGGLDVSELRRLKTLEDENARLKKIVANQAVDIDALKDLLEKKW